MTEEKKEAPKEAAPAAPKTGHTHEHEIPKNLQLKKQQPWEHFKTTKSFKKSAHGFGAPNMNRRTGGKGG